ncbi:MAG: DUF1858 domain-containing protein [Candidatus Micrarchaeia archaeon]|jgi:hybrid cluster-associated redox disulfide protein
MAAVKRKQGKKTKAKASQLVKKTDLLGAVAARYPSTREVFFKHGLHCLGCGVAFAETIEQGAVVHGVDVDALLKELNEAARKDAGKA